MNPHPAFFRTDILLCLEKTAVYGKLLYELSCQPLKEDDRDQLFRAQLTEHHKQKPIQFLDKNRNKILQVGSGRGAEFDKKFIKNVPKPDKNKKLEQKTVRIAEDVLLDVLFKCFVQYEYWGIKALKDTVRQPEAYLRQVLEKIGMLVSHGTFANRWRLRDEFKKVQANGSMAPEVEGGDDGDDDEDDAVVMEDVM